MSSNNSLQAELADFVLTLLPEWAKQEAVILAWPNADTDWQPWLDELLSENKNAYIMNSLLNACRRHACRIST